MSAGKLVGYAALGVAVIALFAFWNHQTNGLLDKLHSTEVTPAAAKAAAPTGGVLPNNEAERAEAAQKQRRQRDAYEKAYHEQTARMQAALKPVTVNAKPVPTTEPQHWNTPQGSKPSGKVYDNRDLNTACQPPKAVPDRRAPVIIVDVDPRYGTRDLDLRVAAADKRLGCAAFSVQPDPSSPRRVNRLYCGP